MVAYVCGTFDTKAAELSFLAARLREAGVATRTVDLSTAQPATGMDVPAAMVAACHPSGAAAVLGLGDRGRAVAAMAEAFARFLPAQADLDGAIGAGGSGGTAMLAAGFQALPVGVPKVLVSTVAGGNVSAYIGASDTAMFPSVTDVQGLNRISRRILGNAAGALAGMMRAAEAPPDQADLPAVGMTMFGVTTACVQQVATLLGGEYEPIVFHAVGTGGRAMEKLALSGLVGGLLDVTTTEIADMLMGGVFAADETRFDAAIQTDLPCVMSVGALDMVNFGPPDTVPARYTERLFYRHNPQVTLMRTTAEENALMARWIAGKVNRMAGPVRLLLPEGGVSALDVPGQPFHDPGADAVLFDTLCEHIQATPGRRVERLPHAINDPAFAEALARSFREVCPP